MCIGIQKEITSLFRDFKDIEYTCSPETLCLIYQIVHGWYGALCRYLVISREDIGKS